MKVSIIAITLAAGALASHASHAAEYPAGSLARRLADKVSPKEWKKFAKYAFGGVVSSQKWPSGSSPKENSLDSDDEEEEEEDIVTTITKTVVVTTTMTREHAAPTPAVKKRNVEESRAPLSTREEAAFLNDVFSLGLFKAGSACNPEFQHHVCASDSVLVCSDSHNVWEVKENCHEKSLKCGAYGAQDGSSDVHVMCLSNNMIALPSDRPSDRIRDNIQTVLDSLRK